MARIKSILNLNKTPQDVENYSLVYAKNIKVDVDKSIVRENGFSKVEAEGEATYIDNMIASIPYNDKIYVLCEGENHKIVIYTFDSETNGYLGAKQTNAIYHGGTIDGLASVDLRGDILITFGEYNTKDGADVPIRTINVSKTTGTEPEESAYTQAPRVPLVNLLHKGYYSHSIPNGVYTFFIRWELYNNYYTPWLPCSKVLFIGNHKYLATQAGHLSYTDYNEDSGLSFVFDVEKITQVNDITYKSFQLGFIIANGDSNKGRIWKKFSPDTQTIYFTYPTTNEIEEVNVEDFLYPVYNLYNVKNIVNFKTNLYISNYKESDFNPPVGKGSIRINIESEVVANQSIDNLDLTYDTDNPNKLISINQSTEIGGGNPSLASYIQGIFGNASNQAFLIENFGGYFNANNEESWTKKSDDLYKATVKTLDGDNTDPINDNDIVRKSISYTDSNNPAYSFVKTQTLFGGVLHGINVVNTREKNIDKDTRLSQLENILFKDLFTKQDIIHYNTNIADGIGIASVAEVGRSIFMPTTSAGWGEKVDDYGIDVSQYDTDTSQYADADPVRNIRSLPIERLSYNDLSDWTDVRYYEYLLRDDKLCQYADRSKNYKFIGDGNNVSDDVRYDKIVISSIKLWDAGNHIIEYQIIRDEYTFASNINDSNQTNIIYDNIQTLLPYQSYDFYVHYVKETGEVTNGYKVNDTPIKVNIDNVDKMVMLKEDVKLRFYPSFSNITLPDGYVACFFSIVHTKDHVIEFNRGRHIVNYFADYENAIADAIELDLGLYSQNSVYSGKGIDTLGNLVDIKARYNHSSDVTTLPLFGNSGKIEILNSRYINAYKGFLIIESELDNENKELVKCTPYITETSYNDGSNLQLDGYISSVSKLLDGSHKTTPNTDLTAYKTLTDDTLYFSSANVYEKTISTPSGGDSRPMISLKEVSGENYTIQNVTDNDRDNLRNAFIIYKSVQQLVYTSYNLNFLDLRETVSAQIKTIKILEGAGTGSISYNLVTFDTTLYILNSLVLSDIYRLPSDFKNYVTRLYSKVKTDEYTEFNNTVRQSFQLGDEEKRYGFYFRATDYYNIPTNKGIIVKLASVGDAILVHTEDSIFRFSGSNTLTAGGGEDVAQIEPNTVFDTGVRELLGSERGYGGIQKKNHSYVDFKGYFFYDASCKELYFYSGQEQVIVISNSIRKWLLENTITDVNIIGDIRNNRILICFAYSVNNVTYYETFSYSFVNNAFASLHDYFFTRAYNTKNATYLEVKLPDKKELYKIENDVNAEFAIPTSIKINSDKGFPYYEHDGAKCAIVDVIVNESYETVKTLNFIQWICNKVLKYSNYNEAHKVNNVPYGFGMAEENQYKDNSESSQDLYNKYKGDYIWIYSDSAFSEIINIINNADGLNISNMNYYKNPKYNKGIWSLNYFRNARGIDENGKYKSDDASLLYGKYFVVRFVFAPTNRFKLENLYANFDNNN